MIIIGITGTIGAGKGAVVDYLKTKNFTHYSAREFLLEEVRKRELDPIRDNILVVANDLRKNHFPGYIISELFKQSQKNSSNAVIESIRSVGEVELLKKEAPHFYLLAVDADPRIRYERIYARKSSTDNVSYEKFVEDEYKESSSQESWGANLPACIKKADFVFQNNGTIEELYAQVDALLSQITAKNNI